MKALVCSILIMTFTLSCGNKSNKAGNPSPPTLPSQYLKLECGKHTNLASERLPIETFTAIVKANREILKGQPLEDLYSTVQANCSY